jgi:hypothetical protein
MWAAGISTAVIPAYATEPKNRKKWHMTDFDVIEGGDGTPQQPNWQLLFSDAGECGAAAGHWSNIVNAMRSAETLSVANGRAIKRLVIAQIVFDRFPE